MIAPPGKIKILFLLLCAFVSVRAQTGTTSVSGQVVDQNAQFVTGASVRLSNTENGFAQTATTDEGGNFAFRGIQPGNYVLEISANGFKKFIKNEIRASVDSPKEISAAMEIGALDETVTVRGDHAAGLLNTQDASVGNTFGSKQVTQLPTEAREVINLLALQPGVTRFGYVAGGRSDQANITLDGVDINNPIFNNIFNPNLRLNAEAIEEFRVTTVNANASQGRSSGAQISLVTKSGTNNLRGAIFLTGRRTAWTANDFFNNRDGVPRPQLDRNVFGGALGGPIWKNRLFFFYSYEGERATRGDTVLRVVPLESLGQGIVRFRTTAGQISSVNCQQIASVFDRTGGCNPHALAVFASAAARYRANSFDAGDSAPDAPLNTAGFRFNADSKVKNNSHLLRLDFNLNANQQFFFRANYINDLETDAPQFPDTPVPTIWSHPTGFVFGHSWTVSKNMFNNFRYGTTRNSFTNTGDAKRNSISFANVFSPLLFSAGNSAIDSVGTIADDVSWVRRNHTFQFGASIRLMRSRLTSFARSFDSATVNPALLESGGNTVTAPLNAYLAKNFPYQISNSSLSGVQSAVAAAIGRYTNYSAFFTFLHDGTLQPAGSPRERDFRSEEYDFYVQDIWKISPRLTLTAGLRYGLSRPVYEAKGYEVKPALSLSEYFERRAHGAASGAPYNQPVVLELSGPANGRTPINKWDKNNFQPRIAAAWSPDFGRGAFGWLLGRNNESVVRGGFSVTNDYLTVFVTARFDNQNALGFATNSQVQNRNLTDRLGERFTGFDQIIRSLPNIQIPSTLTFPRQAPFSNLPSANQFGLDENLVAPINYNWNLTFERVLPAGMIISVSYLGRKARNLLQPRDAAAIVNFVDTQSGTDWYSAAKQLEILRQQSAPVSEVPQIPYFANLFPANLSAQLNTRYNTSCPDGLNQTQTVYALVSGGCGTSFDWTNVQLRLSQLSPRYPVQHIFSHPQYRSYRAMSTIGRSDYNGLTVSLRQRLGTRLIMDFNYTLSKSSDDGSALQNTNPNNQPAAINPFRREDGYALSDFDMRHIVNANAIVQLPFGRGELFFGNSRKFTQLLIGGWQAAGIFRYNSGLPISAPTETGFTTSGNIPSYATRTADVKTCPTRGGSLFDCDQAQAYRSFRNAYPGETGERNIFRLPSFWVLDLGIGKTFALPWENHRLQFRWEVFNLTNTQKMGSVNAADYTILQNSPRDAQPPPNWAKFTAIQGSPRSMQFIFRYSF